MGGGDDGIGYGAFTPDLWRNCSYLHAAPNCTKLDLYPNPDCLDPQTCDQPCLTQCAQSTGGSAKVVGIIITLVFSTVLNFGQNMMRKGHLVGEQAHGITATATGSGRVLPHIRRSRLILQSRAWYWGGLAVFVIGNLGDFLSFLCAPPSIVAPLGSVSLVSNNFIAHFFLGEAIGWTDGGATLLIASGATLTTVFGADDELQMTLNLIMPLLGTARFLSYLLAVLAFCGTTIFLIVRRRRWSTYPPDPKADRAGARGYEVLRFMAVSMSASIGSTTVLASRAVLSMVSAEGGEGGAGGGRSQFTDHPFAWMVWFLMVWVIGSAALQVFMLSWCLKYFDALFVIPLYFAVWASTSLIGDAVLFGVFDCFAAGQWGGVMGGMLLILLGVYLTNRRGGSSATAGKNIIDQTGATKIEQIEGASSGIGGVGGVDARDGTGGIGGVVGATGRQAVTTMVVEAGVPEVEIGVEVEMPVVKSSAEARLPHKIAGGETVASETSSPGVQLNV